jgi:uncharacterized membrane protein
MDPLELLNIASRWVHIATAIVILGGTVFMRFVLLPAAEPLPPAEHDALRARLTARWKKFVMIGIALFLLSGFYNYLAVSVPKHHGDKTYHAWMGIKIIIAFGVFFLASVLVGRSARFEPMRRDRKKWLLVVIVLSFIVVLIASYLKVSGV